MAITVATWNVNGIRARAEQLDEWLVAHRPEVFCLQEIKAKPEQIPEGLRALGDYWMGWHGAGGYSGVALGVRRDISSAPPEFFHPAFDFETRSIAVVVGGFEFSSLYVPNGGKDFAAKLSFLEAVRGWLTADVGTTRRRVVCGDFNVAREERDIHPKERKAGQIGARPEERELFAGWLASGLADVARELDPGNDELFTWWPPWRSMRQRNIGWRIDYVLAGAELGGHVRSCRVQREFGTSDHAPVLATFEV